MDQIKYTAEIVRESLQINHKEYLDKLFAGRSPRWNCDQRTKDLFCLSQWLMVEIPLQSAWHSISDEDRLDTLDFFNRKSRAEENLFELAALAMNNLLENKIERFRRKAIK